MDYSRSQKNILVLLRLFVGWHFLYEGVVKLFQPAWSAKTFLLTSDGVLRPFFVWLAEGSMMSVVDVLNIALLIAVGAALLLGVMTRVAAIVGIVLLAMYYLAHPPFGGTAIGPGSFWIVNYNLIEMAALLVCYYFPTSRHFGLDALRARAEVST